MVASAAPAAPVRTFVPKDLDVSDVDQLRPHYQALLDRPIHSPADLEKWLADLSELTSVFDEYFQRRFVDKSCHTDDPALEKAFLHAVEVVEPATKPFVFALQKKFIASPFAQQLTGQRFEMLRKKWNAEIEIFRDENVPLDTEATKLVNEYEKTCGAMTVLHNGRELTLQQLARELEEPDRAKRQWAWELTANRRLVDRGRIDGLFDQLLPLRQRIAKNAGLPDFRAYAWKMHKRFDYTPDDCHRFADAIERVCVPALRQLDAQRKADLNLDSLRPWDLSVDPRNRPPLRPYQSADELIAKTHEIFSRLSPALADDFDSLRRNHNLDLESRKGKQPGGYQTTFEEVRQPFIFMNAAGTHLDVQVLLHEGGHAFHTLAAHPEPLVFLRSAPIEFCEVASMAMEMLGGEHYDVFYADERDRANARRQMFERILVILPWIATIDQFQHWLYTHPTHTGAERTAHWLSLIQRFGREVDWSGYEPVREASWQPQLHLFSHPFYYVEYGIAQLGAMQLWMKSKTDPRRALSNYRAALSLGGTRPLPDLFSAAGIRFDFSEQTLRPLIGAIEEEMSALPR